jgi:hypothetical protein
MIATDGEWPISIHVANWYTSRVYQLARRDERSSGRYARPAPPETTT